MVAPDRSGSAFRPAVPEDAAAISTLIMRFRAQLAIDPTGAGAEKFFASVSPEAQARYIRSDRYTYLIAEIDGRLAGVIAMRDGSHLFHLFVASEHQRCGLARELWRRHGEAVRAPDRPVFRLLRCHAERASCARAFADYAER